MSSEPQHPFEYGMIRLGSGAGQPPEPDAPDAAEAAGEAAEPEADAPATTTAADATSTDAGGGTAWMSTFGDFGVSAEPEASGVGAASAPEVAAAPVEAGDDDGALPWMSPAVDAAPAALGGDASSAAAAPEEGEDPIYGGSRAASDTFGWDPGLGAVGPGSSADGVTGDDFGSGRSNTPVGGAAPAGGLRALGSADSTPDRVAPGTGPKKPRRTPRVSVSPNPGRLPAELWAPRRTRLAGALIPLLLGVAGLVGAGVMWTLLHSLPLASTVLLLGITGALFCHVMLRE